MLKVNKEISHSLGSSLLPIYPVHFGNHYYKGLLSWDVGSQESHLKKEQGA